MTTVTLDRVTKTYGSNPPPVDDLSLTIADGEFFTLLGPSGCGKSTTLRMLAGFILPTSGTIRFNEQDVTRAAPNKRDTGMVFQNYALFPHMDVGENVAFGLRMRKVGSAERSRRVQEALAAVGLQGYDDRRIEQLSGGQQQRVALARALVIQPSVLLLDEPLSNLDAKLRDETRTQIREIQRAAGTTSVYVTHDQAEAMAMSDRIAVMSAGRLHQVGTPREIYQRPATAFVARFIGRSNVFDATVAGLEAGTATVRLADGSILTTEVTPTSPTGILRVGDPVAASIRPESLVFDGTVGAASDRPVGVIHARVTLVEFTGSHCLIAGDVAMPNGEQRVLVSTPDTDELPAVGDLIALRCAPERVWLVEK